MRPSGRNDAGVLPFDALPTRSISLVKLAGELARAIADIGPITVEGEVHRPTTSGANRTYFTLRDRGAQISVTVPAARQRFAKRVRDGERVAVSGTIEYQPERGGIQLVATEVVPTGAGAIAAMIAEARERLRVEGVLDRPRRPLPLLPRMVGVVCGTDAAVKKDIESVIESRFPGFPIRFYEVTVSGPGAVEAICGALSALCSEDFVDVVVLARGGGDAAQLLPFSDEALCRAVANATVPVVAAIGHDGDRPLVDEVADARAGTPSIAASLVVPERVSLVRSIDEQLMRCRRAIDRTSERSAARLFSVAWRDRIDRRIERAAVALSSTSIDHVLDRALVDALSSLERVRIDPLMERRIDRANHALLLVGARIDALSPMRVLERGYAVVTDDFGRVVTDVEEVADRAPLTITLSTGAFAATADRARLAPAFLGRESLIATAPNVSDVPDYDEKPESR